MKIINYILIFFVLTSIGFIYILMNRINDLKDKVNNISVTTGGNVDIQEIEDKVNQAVLDTIEPINSSIRRINNDIQSLSDQSTSFSTETSNTDDNIYQRARLVSAEELGYEVDTFGNIIFIKPVTFLNSVTMSDLKAPENSTCNVTGDFTFKGASTFDGNATFNQDATFNDGLITETIRNGNNSGSITFNTDGNIIFDTEGSSDTHTFGESETIINNMLVGGHFDEDDFYTIRFKTAPNNNDRSDNRNQYHFMGCKDGRTFINSFDVNNPKREENAVCIRRDNDKNKGRLLCSMFRAPVFIPLGNGRVNGIDYRGLPTNTGWNGDKISRAMCMIDAKNNDVVLLNIQVPGYKYVYSEWAQISNQNNGHKYIRTFGHNGHHTHNFRLRDEDGSNGQHIRNYNPHGGPSWGSRVNNCRITTLHDDQYIDSFMREYPRINPPTGKEF